MVEVISSVITIASVPHTGTHSVIELFRNEEYNEFGLNNFEYGVVKLDETKTSLISGHIVERNIQTIKDLNKLSQIIVPIRDPLLSLISAHARNVPRGGEIKTTDSEGCVSISITSKVYKLANKMMGRQLLSWILWAEEIFELKPFHAPLDLGVAHLKYGDICFKDIGIHNTIGDYPLKQAYYDRDLSYIASKLDDKLRYLIELEPILRPPLEELGYKDLLWWDK